MSVVRCICCNSEETIELVSLDRIPVLCNELHATAEDAKNAPFGRMDLFFCQSCGHYFNCSYDENKLYYSANYETSLYSSAVFQDYADNLVNRLIDRYDIRNKKVLEIGCGRGEFLKLICTKGNNQGIGFDTSVLSEGQDCEVPGVSFVRDYFSDKYDDITVDFVICQQVLEHVVDPKSFLTELTKTKTFRTNNCTFYCEVPNGLYTIEDLGIWDLIYEHVSYFSADSLERLFKEAGFEILDLGTTFGNQYLYVEARLSSGEVLSKDTASSVSLVDNALALKFADRFKSKMDDFRRLLQSENFSSGQTFIWGAGSKGITFSNLIDPDGNLAGLVDKNPAKHGQFIGGTGQKIMKPEQLQDACFSAAFVMNPQYLNEIEKDLQALGIKAELYSA